MTELGTTRPVLSGSRGVEVEERRVQYASLDAFGPQRTAAYAPLPKWRRKAKRPSCLDLITLLRKEMAENPHLLAQLGFYPSYQDFTASAAA